MARRIASSPVPSVGRRIQAISVSTERTPDASRAATPNSAPFDGRRLPKNRITQNEAKGIAGTIQKWSRRNTQLTLHQVDAGDVDAAPVAVDQQHNGQADADLGRR